MFNPNVPYAIDATSSVVFPYNALQNYNLVATRSKTNTYTWAALLNGVAYNLTGASLRFIAKYNLTDNDGAAIFNKTIGSGITVTSAPSGLFTTTLAPSDTASLGSHSTDLFYEIQVTDGSGNVYPLAIGILTVLPNVVITTP